MSGSGLSLLLILTIKRPVGPLDRDCSASFFVELI